MNVVVSNGIHAYSPMQAQFNFESAGVSFFVETYNPDNDEEGREFGPFLLVDAIAYAEHAVLESDPSVWLDAMEKRHDAVDYRGRTPRNDWTGVLANVAG